MKKISTTIYVGVFLIALVPTPSTSPTELSTWGDGYGIEFRMFPWPMRYGIEFRIFPCPTWVQLQLEQQSLHLIDSAYTVSVSIRIVLKLRTWFRSIETQGISQDEWERTKGSSTHGEIPVSDVEGHPSMDSGQVFLLLLTGKHQTYLPLNEGLVVVVVTVLQRRSCSIAMFVEHPHNIGMYQGLCRLIHPSS